jgi:hypothetical protein
MAFFTIQRNGFKDTLEMVQQVIEDLADHGFTVVYPSSYVPSSRIDYSTATEFNVILEAGADVDPLYSSQPWRIGFCASLIETFQTGAVPAVRTGVKVLKQNIAVAVASPLQLNNDGKWQGIVSNTGAFATVAGAVGAPYAPTFSDQFADKLMDSADVSTGFINRETRFPSWRAVAPTPGAEPVIVPGPTHNNGGAFPLNYRLTVTSRGIFLGVFEGNWASVIDGSLIASDAFFSWMLVQRPVNKDTGNILVTGKSPVFCINCVNKKYWKFVARESDIPHPSPPVRAELHSEDNFKLINPQNQVSLTEDKKYTVSFIHNLNTPRFRYSEELDMISIVSSDIVMESVNIPISAYGGTRIYTSLPCNQAFNTGAKVLVLTFVS